jgi:hypothetical protein
MRRKQNNLILGLASHKKIMNHLQNIFDSDHFSDQAWQHIVAK